MRTITLNEGEAHLSRLLDQAASGNAFIIARNGKPLVRVVPIDRPTVSDKTRISFLGDRLDIPNDFDEMGRAEIAALFEGW